MAGHTSTFGQQFSGFAFGFSGFVRHGNSGAVLLVVDGNIGNVLFGQRLGNAAHGWMFALTGFVSIQRSSDVLGTLTRDHGHFVNLRKTGLVALDAMATNAHGNFCRPGLGIALELLGHSGSGHTSGSKGQHKRQFGVHVEKTSERVEMNAGDYIDPLCKLGVCMQTPPLQTIMGKRASCARSSLGTRPFALAKSSRWAHRSIYQRHQIWCARC